MTIIARMYPAPIFDAKEQRVYRDYFVSKEIAQNQNSQTLKELNIYLRNGGDPMNYLILCADCSSIYFGKVMEEIITI